MEWPNNFVNKSALFGFNSGNYKDFYSNQESFTTNIRNLDNTSNVDIPGRWIFRTDQSGELNDLLIIFILFFFNQKIFLRGSTQKFFEIRYQS